MCSSVALRVAASGQFWSARLRVVGRLHCVCAGRVAPRQHHQLPKAHLLAALLCFCSGSGGGGSSHMVTCLVRFSVVPFTAKRLALLVFLVAATATATTTTTTTAHTWETSQFRQLACAHRPALIWRRVVELERRAEAVATAASLVAPCRCSCCCC